MRSEPEASEGHGPGGGSRSPVARRTPADRVGWIAFAVVLACLAPGSGQAHVFPDRTEPRVGHTVETSPRQVRIWFDGDLEPMFSTLRVENAREQQVDRGDAHLDPADATLLEVDLPPLPAGRYTVFWSVVARDGHRTEGSFPFEIR
jgi:methionine-rich copper-binding protein CopC